ncbi:MAG: lysine 2,3-aminomutase [Deltaproteobacteria bacterium]|nr:MAG: lysine 2,3-aminomutase [Deltaproteobacteria bacterium]
MTDWKEILRSSITSPQELPSRLKDGCGSDMAEVVKRYPMRINPYYLGLIKDKGDPIWRQAVPHPAEIKDYIGMADPLAEENLSPVPNLVHKYPDRVLFLVSARCAMYCRFCTRKRKVGKSCMKISKKNIQDAVRYLENTPTIHDVLLSGGDPLLLEDGELDDILGKIHAISHIYIIRIGSRVPCTLPMRITPSLVKILTKYQPLYINTHFNHPMELTSKARLACERLADGGIPLACQTVLLKNINDDSRILKKLFYGLLKMRVRPYYLFQADLTQGTNHFRTATQTGINIMRDLIGSVSGMAVPTYALDAPGGKGKIPLTPQYILKNGQNLHFNNYLGEKCCYPEIADI